MGNPHSKHVIAENDACCSAKMHAHDTFDTCGFGALTRIISTVVYVLIIMMFPFFSSSMRVSGGFVSRHRQLWKY